MPTSTGGTSELATEAAPWFRGDAGPGWLRAGATGFHAPKLAQRGGGTLTGGLLMLGLNAALEVGP